MVSFWNVLKRKVVYYKQIFNVLVKFYFFISLTQYILSQVNLRVYFYQDHLNVFVSFKKNGKIHSFAKFRTLLKRKMFIFLILCLYTNFWLSNFVFFATFNLKHLLHAWILNVNWLHFLIENLKMSNLMPSLSGF